MKAVVRRAGCGCLVVLLGLSALVFVGIRACDFDRRCITMTYPDHCEGAVAVQCEGGWGTILPVVRRTDCRKALGGPGVCVELPHPSGSSKPFHWCRTLCDPTTYVPRCYENIAPNCLSGGELGLFEVVQVSCNPTIERCALRTDAEGVRRAACVGSTESVSPDVGPPTR